MKKVAFTICAKNYIGLAQTLEKSLKSFNDDVDFFIFVADEITVDAGNPLPENIIIAKDAIDISMEVWHQMSFKYDLTEFCTSIKPSCFKYVFEELHADASIYFDPDIFIYSSLELIFEQLLHHSIILTPHITSIEKEYSGKLNEQSLLYSGMYNLGFLALKRDSVSEELINWWIVRLKDRCFQNKMENLFTDQKWMDFIPAFYPDNVLISHNLGLNVAPWNFYERAIISKDECLYVVNRIHNNMEKAYPLVFIHFSGFDYLSMLDNKISQGNISNLQIPADYLGVFGEYVKSLKESALLDFINLSYSYNFFSNQVYISTVYRKLFRRLIEDQKEINDPFDSNGYFYLSLAKAGLIKKRMLSSDKSSVRNIEDIEGKTLIINKILNIFFKLIGPAKFFQLVRLMRLYSKVENHVYLVDKSYLQRFKIWN